MRINLHLILICLFSLAFTSCINEYPHPEKCIYNVTLNVHSQTDWLPDYEMDVTRSEATGITYQFKIFESGTTTFPILEKTIVSDDLSRADFSIYLPFHQGKYDIYVWSDFCDASGTSLFYNSSDFAGITYKSPYQGDSEYKDAFRGATSIYIDYTMEGQPIVKDIILSRPLARYMLIASDVEDFIGSEAAQAVNTKSYNASMFDDYLGVVRYPLYMPAVFNNFLNKPIDSWSDVSFSGQLKNIGNGEVLVGMDYVMINGEESSVQLAVSILDPSGMEISASGTLNIPIKRGRTTLVYGKFLTTPGEGNITIDPEFKGQYNIEYN